MCNVQIVRQLFVIDANTSRQEGNFTAAKKQKNKKQNKNKNKKCQEGNFTQ